MILWYRFRWHYGWATSYMAVVTLLLTMLHYASSNDSRCGGTLTEPYGVIQTPGFPSRFSVPIKCHWLINASYIPPDQDVKIFIYLTQLYVMKGLTVTSYLLYGETWGKNILFTVTEKNVTELSWILGRTRYLVLDFELSELEGNHIRALYGLMDVYGFNITYEITTRHDGVKPKSCGVLQCSYLGNCYVEKDMSRFWCSCFEGYSGENCSHGPLCEPGRSMCQNGATCSHLGANAVTCYCPAGFTGPHCDVQLRPPHKEECSDTNCQSRCPSDGHRPKGARIPSADRARFEGTVRLQNYAALSRQDSERSLTRLIETELLNYLKNISKISSMADFRVLNITNGGEVTFHFFGPKKEGSRMRDALNQLVKKKHLKNLTFVSTQIAFRQEPSLLLQSVKANIDITRGVREGEEFFITCVAQGSSNMSFQWLKDGVFVNTSKATRTIWTHRDHPDTLDQYTDNLFIQHASVLDGGVYTCQVEDWGDHQCKSVRISVPIPPIVNIIPNSVTLRKGDNASIVCISPSDRQPNTFGYNWTKNKLLFKMESGKEVWEELRPGGSVLKITNVQKSAKYSCEAHNGSLRTIVDVHVEVLNETPAPLCPREFSENITWSETKANVDSIQECPPGFSGTVKRLCVVKDANLPVWETPNLSSCFAKDLEETHINFLKLTCGYQNTTASKTMLGYLNYLQKRPILYSGEGESILSLVQEVVDYVNATKSYEEVHNVSKSLYKIVDLLLKSRNSILDPKIVAQLQRIIRGQAVLMGSLLRTSGELHENYSSFTVDAANLDSATIHNLHVPLRLNSYPRWFGDKLDLRIETGSAIGSGGGSGEVIDNGSFAVAVVAYKNISEFLPARASARTRTGLELEYEIISSLLSVWVGRDHGRLFYLASGAVWLDLELHHAAYNISWEAWSTICAVTDVADDGPWDMESCTTLSFNSTLTKCTCSKMGTFAILLMTRPAYMALTAVRQYHLVILLGCVCCLVQVVVTLGVLLLYWWYHRSCLVFLKVQCCAATIGAMTVFLYALCNDLQSESFPYVATFLETFLLVGMSSHLSKLLIVYTELVQLTRVRSLKPTVVGIISGVPLVAICGNHLAHRSIGRQLDSWWLIFGTMVFNIFVISSAVMFVLFLFLYFSVMRKLHLLVTKHLTNSKALHKRIGLLRRSALIYICMVAMVIASIMYINIQDDVVWHYILSISCALLGFLQLICYVVKCENSMRAHLAKKLKLHGNDDEFSSDSANSPLSFFTKQEPDAESESAPPRQSRGKGVGRIDSTEGLLLANTQRKLKYPSSEAPSTIETYLHSISEDSVEQFEDEARPDGKEDVDLELYNSSPKKYRKSPIDAALYSESEKMYPEHWFLRHPEGQYMPHPPDILTTRVCVELGLVPSTNPAVEANILVEGSPIMLCNVEVEPCEVLDITNGTMIEPISSNRPNTELSDVEEESSEIEVSSERKQPEGRDTNTDNDDNLDGMLDRISHDLDYLLNRSTIPEIQITPATIPFHGRKTSKLPSSSIRGQIKEEDESKEDNEETVNEELGIAKTAC